jgi:hypothetical protein
MRPSVGGLAQLALMSRLLGDASEELFVLMERDKADKRISMGI